jgi:hypothetical protein
MSENKDNRLLKKFQTLESEWRDETDALSVMQLKERIAEAAKIREENETAWDDDQHVQEKAIELNDAEAGFKEIRERQTLKMKYALKVLATKT